MAAGFSFARFDRIGIEHVGTERQPLLIADDFLDDAERLVGLAAESDFTPAFGPAGGYPGLRAPAPLDYVGAAVRHLVPLIAQGFALGEVRPVRAECNFSLVTLAPHALVPAQRAPHVDTADPWQFAILHYLCAPSFGGTSFFRHRATGFETLTPARMATYDAARADEGDDGGYVDAGGAWFEGIGGVDAAFNRVTVYRSHLLHSGRILAPESLSADPRRGRLTANIFLTLRPA